MLQAAKNRAESSPEEMEEINLESVWKYAHLDYNVESTGAKSTMMNSRSLINEYCQKLPSDR